MTPLGKGDGAEGLSCDLMGVVRRESLLWYVWGGGTGGTSSDGGGALRTSKLDEEERERLPKFFSLSRLRRRGITGMLDRAKMIFRAGNGPEI